MDSAKLNDWLQVIGLFGVIGSLIFVGLQMKQEHEIAVANAYHARSEQVTNMLAQFATDPAVRSGMIKRESGRIDEITADEDSALAFFAAATFNFYENVHFQYQNGFITEEHWAKSRGGMKSFLRNPATRAYVLRDRTGWRESFRILLEEIIAEIDAESNPGSEQRSDPR